MEGSSAADISLVYTRVKLHVLFVDDLSLVVSGENLIIDGFGKAKRESPRVIKPYGNPVTVDLTIELLLPAGSSLQLPEYVFLTIYIPVSGVVIGDGCFDLFWMLDVCKVSIYDKLVPGVPPVTIPVICPVTIGIEKSSKGSFIPQHHPHLLINLTLC